MPPSDQRAPAGAAGRRRCSAPGSRNWRRSVSPSMPGCTIPQIPELTALARAFPDTRIVLDHFGGPLGIGAVCRTARCGVPAWAASIRDLATCPNVWVKLGGLGMPLTGFGFHERLRRPPRSNWPRHGGPISRPASRRSARTAACSRATSPWIKSRTVCRVLERLQASDTRRERGGAGSALSR